MTGRSALLTGSLFAGLAVVLGAFGAHALKDMLASSGRTDTYELAVRYQFYHAFALLVAGLLNTKFALKHFNYAATCFSIGIVFFCGSLYILCFSGIKFLGAITPIGGLFFIAGWIFNFFGILTSARLEK
ncbi:DUF423 domain-containing protein [Chryseosolibacter indicus]|uniref:DUF423 domain-containing protein n=1 Tax=Chryseosolibacter indicus TaxID=2782351 RepID=A0ABS5VLY1_9BACT|nr:DUF423 domain-containing protein [Chryseosolibacter indicus]MBT1702459.1 DUF423 domain-containing protein [Chryseosolibacter indicus]